MPAVDGTRGLTVTTGTGDFAWATARRPPDPRLRGLVDSVCGYTERSAVDVTRRVVPHPALTVILSLGPAIDVDGSPRTSFVAGLHDGWGITRFAGDQCGIELRLSPLGAERLLGMPASELTGQIVSLPLLDRLADRAAAAPTWAARLDVVEDGLLRTAGDGTDDPAIAWAWRTMRRRAGAVRVGDLADEIGWSRRHFVSRFRAGVGLPPKVAARVLRFDRARALMGRGTPPAVVAASCGYADQSHLVREFRALAGCTPGAYLAELDPEQVTFVQDDDRSGDLASAA